LHIIAVGRTLGMKLRDWLKSKKMRQADLAEQIGMDQSAISLLCNGRAWPTEETARRIALATRGAVLPNDFFDFDFERDFEREAA
jgi:3,4-dihydroxy 2-butanone 4-phosphate synthase / GTP cyclohydrolase II